MPKKILTYDTGLKDDRIRKNLKKLVENHVVVSSKNGVGRGCSLFSCYFLKKPQYLRNLFDRICLIKSSDCESGLKGGPPSDQMSYHIEILMFLSVLVKKLWGNPHN